MLRTANSMPNVCKLCAECLQPIHKLYGECLQIVCREIANCVHNVCNAVCILLCQLFATLLEDVLVTLCNLFAKVLLFPFHFHNSAEYILQSFAEYILSRHFRVYLTDIF